MIMKKIISDANDNGVNDNTDDFYDEQDNDVYDEILVLIRSIVNNDSNNNEGYDEQMMIKKLFKIFIIKCQRQ